MSAVIDVRVFGAIDPNEPAASAWKAVNQCKQSCWPHQPDVWTLTLSELRTVVDQCMVSSLDVPEHLREAERRQRIERAIAGAVAGDGSQLFGVPVRVRPIAAGMR